MSDDIKERLLNESYKGQEAMRREALARIEALEAQVERLKSPAKECYHEEGCTHWVKVVARNDAFRAQLAAAREALEKITGRREFDLSDLENVEPDQTPEEYVCEQALAPLPAPAAAPTREEIMLKKLADGCQTKADLLVADRSKTKDQIVLDASSSFRWVADEIDAILALKAAPAK